MWQNQNRETTKNRKKDLPETERKMKTDLNMNTDTETSVLFIGNSYTFYNDLEALVANVAASTGRTVRAERVVKGGHTLPKMNDPADETGAKVEEKLAGPERFDAVFLQDHSCGPIRDREGFFRAVRELSAKWKAKGARVLLYETWGRKDGSEVLDELGMTSEEMTKALAQTYREAGNAFSLEVSPVGEAFRDVYISHPEIGLYDQDRSHPSPAGSYLAALCHYGALFGVSPVGVPYRFGTASESEAHILQAAAEKALGRRLF